MLVVGKLGWLGKCFLREKCLNESDGTMRRGGPPEEIIEPRVSRIALLALTAEHVRR